MIHLKMKHSVWMLLVLRDKPSLIRLMFVNETLFVFSQNETRNPRWDLFNISKACCFHFHLLCITLHRGNGEHSAQNHVRERELGKRHGKDLPDPPIKFLPIVRTTLSDSPPLRQQILSVAMDSDIDGKEPFDSDVDFDTDRGKGVDKNKQRLSRSRP